MRQYNSLSITKSRQTTKLQSTQLNVPTIRITCDYTLVALQPNLSYHSTNMTSYTNIH